MIRITAVIAAYNVEKYIQRSINSVLNQTYKPFEILVVDDGSTDNTAKLIHLYGSKVKYVHKENGGVSSAKNLGIIESQGDWIAFLDSDDEWVETHLENFIKTIEKKNDLKWFGAPIKHVDQETGKILSDYNKKYKKKFINKPYFDDYLAAIPPIGFFSAPTMIIKKEVFQKVGLFDVSKKNGQDSHMWFRIGLYYPMIGYTGQVGTIVYKRSDSVSRVKTFNVDNSINQYVECEILAKSLGKDYFERAKPRIQYWVRRKVRQCIYKGDYDSLVKLKENVEYYFSFSYKVNMLIRFPVFLKLFTLMRK